MEPENDVLKELDELIEEAKKAYKLATPGSLEQERLQRMLIEFIRTREEIKNEEKRRMDKDHDDFIAFEKEEAAKERDEKEQKRKRKEEKNDRALKWVTGIATALASIAACAGGLFLTARGQRLDYDFGNSTSNTNKVLSRNAVPKW